MRKTEGCLPRSPSLRTGCQPLPIIHLAGKMLGRKNRRRGHHHQLDVGNGHSHPLGLLLGVLHHADELWDAIGLGIILVHVGGLNH